METWAHTSGYVLRSEGVGRARAGVYGIYGDNEFLTLKLTLFLSMHSGDGPHVCKASTFPVEVPPQLCL